MVKIYCDRCNEIIEDEYYTIDVCKHDLYSMDGYTVTCEAIGYSNSRGDILRMLNSQKIYCKKCREQIEAYALKI